MSPLCFSKGSDITLSSCQQAGFTPKIAAVRKDVEDIKGLVSSSIQIALLPVDCLYDHIPRSIQKIRFSYPQVTRTVGIIRQKEGANSFRKKFLQICKRPISANGRIFISIKENNPKLYFLERLPFQTDEDILP
jgi:hypothetical protein